MRNIHNQEYSTYVYIDESCHIGHGSGKMLLGAVWLNTKQLPMLLREVKYIKKKHKISSHREIKWTKVSLSKIEYYKDLLLLLHQTDQVSYRAVVIDKNKVNYEAHNETSDDFYYKMQYYLVRNIAEKSTSTHSLRLFLDYKDTWSGHRSHELARYLRNTVKFQDKYFTAQPLRSHEVIGLQLADLVTGAVMYANKPSNQQKSEAKKELVAFLKKITQQELTSGTPPSTEKFNLFFWEPRE